MPLAAGRVEENRRTALDLVHGAIACDAKLILLPEACLTDLYLGSQMLAERIPGPSTIRFADILSDALIALPMLERSRDGKTYSSCALITSFGVRHVLRRTHLYRDPQRFGHFDEA